jgi:hypothetical protein
MGKVSFPRLALDIRLGKWLRDIIRLWKRYEMQAVVTESVRQPISGYRKR